MHSFSYSFPLWFTTILNTIPCAIQQGLVLVSFYTYQFASANSKLTALPFLTSPPHWWPQICSLCLWVHFCLVDLFICRVHLSISALLFLSIYLFSLTLVMGTCWVLSSVFPLLKYAFKLPLWQLQVTRQPFQWPVLSLSHSTFFPLSFPSFPYGPLSCCVLPHPLMFPTLTSCISYPEPIMRLRTLPQHQSPKPHAWSVSSIGVLGSVYPFCWPCLFHPFSPPLSPSFGLFLLPCFSFC